MAEHGFAVRGGLQVYRLCAYNAFYHFVAHKHALGYHNAGIYAALTVGYKAVVKRAYNYHADFVHMRGNHHLGAFSRLMHD